MRASSVKLKIHSFGIEESIILEGGNNKSVKYLLDKYISSHPNAIAKGLAYTESGGYLKSLRYNDAAGRIIIEKETPSRRIGGGSYVTIFWYYTIIRVLGGYTGRLPRGGVPMDEIINFKDGDTLSLGLVAVLSNVSI